MRVKVCELEPGPEGFVLDNERLHCIIDVKEGEGKFWFKDPSREKLIRSLFSAPVGTFVGGGKSPEGVYFDAIETHPALSVEAIEAIVKEQLYGFNLGATIEYDG